MNLFHNVFKRLGDHMYCFNVYPLSLYMLYCRNLRGILSDGSLFAACGITDPGFCQVNCDSY